MRYWLKKILEYFRPKKDWAKVLGVRSDAAGKTFGELPQVALPDGERSFSEYQDQHKWPEKKEDSSLIQDLFGDSLSSSDTTDY